MVKKNRQLRYIEISRRNLVSRIFVGTGSFCSKNIKRCGDICIDIIRAGAYNCNPRISFNDCCQVNHQPMCDPIAGHVCATEIDDDGYAVFEWPNELLNLKEGWYEAHIVSDCRECGVIPLRIGPRCNVIEVETLTNGPDSLCYVGCDDECSDDICSTQNRKEGNKIYKPSYEVI